MMKRIGLALLATAAALSASQAWADSRHDANQAVEAVRPTQGKGTAPAHDQGARKPGAQELPSGAQTGGMHTGVPEGAGRRDTDPAANHPSTTGPDTKANPDNPRGAGTEHSRSPQNR